MLKGLLKSLDTFLPDQFSDSVEAPLQYRGRVIIATNIVSLGALAALWSAIAFINASIIVHIGIFLCIVTLIGHLSYLKNQVENFERNIKIGATLQVVMLTALIYVTAFSIDGMGFFGLIWLIPVFLMIAFYFNTRFSFYFAIGNFAVFCVVSVFKYIYFYEPLVHAPNFPKMFVLFLGLVIACAYMLAFLFVHLNEELQTEVVKQRDLLVESAKFQTLGKMASNLAHDINNPLFTIQGKLHQIRNLLSRDQLDLEKCDQIVESVEATLLKLSQIVKGISTFAREGRGDQMVSIAVDDLIESNLALAMDRIKAHEIDITVEVDHEAMLICYPSFISQVLLNLLNNAIDALESAEKKFIEVRAFKDKGWVYIAISDAGVGVPKEIESKIFEPFFTTKKVGKGTGLGLSISKGLVEVHEGALTYERKDDMSTFLVKLPAYE